MSAAALDEVSETERRALELFETPHTLADELAGMLDVRPGHRVLEPSAGRGALCRALVRRRCRKADIVTVEIAPKLCASLQRQGFQPRQADFLELRAGDLGELFDRVILNPPFSGLQDIAHVRHAMRFLRPGGVLVAVMSAGVNFRQDRAARDFRAYVEAIGGTIDELPEGSFEAAGTRVRTVVVRLVQPGGAAEHEQELESTDIVPIGDAPANDGEGAEAEVIDPEPERPRREPRNAAEANPFQTDYLSIPRNVEQLVRAYEQGERDIRAGYGLIAQGQAGVQEAFTNDGLQLRNRHGRISTSDHEVDDVLRELRRSVWYALIQRLELPRIMSNKAWRELCRQVDSTEPPEITEENVMAMAKQYRDRFEDMVRESVREVFDILRPHHTDYKTNAKVKWQCGRKVILTYWCERGWGGKGYRPNWNRHQEMTALENVFSNLDGKGFANKTLNRSELANAIETSPDGRGETPYFKFRCFANQNVHLEMRRMDLVRRLNLLAGGGSLKPRAEDQ